MGGCRCSFRNCKSATKTNSDLHFFHYPVKHRDRCNEWVRNARRPEFHDLPDDQLRNKVVCDLHFEKCYFTNVLRKRLVHNAVPTLAAGCVEEILNEGANEFSTIDILPANEDGTIFTLDTDSMQHKNDDPISTYSFKNGTLVPVFNEEQDVNDPLIYTLDTNDFKTAPNFQENNHESNYVFLDANKETDNTENYEIVFNGVSQQPSIEKKMHPGPTVEIMAKMYSRPEAVSKQKPITLNGPLEIVYCTQPFHATEDLEESKYESSKEEEVSPPKVDAVENTNLKSTILKVKANKRGVKKKVLKQINNHTREIASLKKALLRTNLQMSRKVNLNAFKGKVHPTFLGALSLNLYKKESNFNQNEMDFLITLYKTSPECYKLLKEKLQWSLPTPDIVEKLIDQQTVVLSQPVLTLEK